MKLSLKEFLEQLIVEHIHVNKENGELIFQQGDPSAGGMTDAISTASKARGYSSDKKWPNEETGEDKVKLFFVCTYRRTELTSEMLRVIKGLPPRGDFAHLHINSQTYEKLINFVVNYLADWLPKSLLNVKDTPHAKKFKPTFLVYPRSSSPFLKDVVNKLRPKIEREIRIVDDLFIKRNLNHENELDINSVVNTEHPDWNSLTDKTKKEIFATARRAIAGGQGSLAVKRIYAPYRKFFKNFMDFPTEHTDALEYLENELVFVLDDIYASGTSLQDTVRLLKLCNPREIACVVIFKNVAQA
jgi:hypothetical protein